MHRSLKFHHRTMIVIGLLMIVAYFASFVLNNDDSHNKLNRRKLSQARLPQPIVGKPSSTKNAERTETVHTNASTTSETIDIELPAVEDGDLIIVPFSDRTAPLNFTIYSHPNKTRAACAQNLTLLVMVNSMPADFEIRHAIRETWAVDNPEYTVTFVIGSPHNRTTSNSRTCGVDCMNTTRELYAEQEIHQDLLLTTIVEHFYNLPLKTYLMMYWSSTYCPDVRCTMKTDSDVIVFAHNLAALCVRADRHLCKLGACTAKIYGKCWENVKVVRTQNLVSQSTPDISATTQHFNMTSFKRGVPYDVYPNVTYPQYCSGSGYLLINGVPRRLMESTPVRRWPVEWRRNTPEDVTFTGIIAQAANVTRVALAGFSAIRKIDYDGCYVKRRYTTHGFKSASELRRAWALFTKQARQPCTSTTATTTPTTTTKRRATQQKHFEIFHDA